MMRSSGREMELSWKQLYSDEEPSLLAPMMRRGHGRDI